ncbi:hypothetical protein [Patulibacter sp. SYSU D01012]|uniref:hypothetical protein n=1 Tax=Patulibacter sp. SYSU D01012 TaxID=2817381 RepID=UPI001B312721|nr:hypothetical protein [Patulibacter sp. SYSU D01012]
MRATLPRPALRLAATLGALLALLLIAAAPRAQAANDQWSCTLYSGWYCGSDPHSLRSSSIYSSLGLKVGAGASRTGSASDLYGDWAISYGYACRSLSGNTVLYPLVVNASTAGSWFVAASTYGSGADSC